MYIAKLSPAENVITASGIVLFIASFLPWFTAETNIRGISRSGWEIGVWGWIPALIGVAMVAQVVASTFAPRRWPSDARWPALRMIGGIVAAVLVLLKLLIGADAFGVDLDRAYGVFVALLAGLGLAAGGILDNRTR